MQLGKCLFVVQECLSIIVGAHEFVQVLSKAWDVSIVRRQRNLPTSILETWSDVKGCEFVTPRWPGFLVEAGWTCRSLLYENVGKSFSRRRIYRIPRASSFVKFISFLPSLWFRGLLWVCWVEPGSNPFARTNLS